MQRQRVLIGMVIAAGLAMAIAIVIACAEGQLTEQNRAFGNVTRQPPTPVPSRTLLRTYFPFVLSVPPKRIYMPFLSHARATPTPTATPQPTSTPAPTPTPTPPWPEPLEKAGRSKLGLHVQWNNSPDIMEFIRRAKPAVVKSVGDFGFLAEVKQISPTTVTIARLDKASQRMEGDPVLAARAFVAENLEQYQLNPAVDYWEGYNEPGVRDRMEWYAAFEAERARLMAEHGFRVAVGAFSAGVPEWEEFAAFLPAIEAAYKHNGILTLHEYDAPTMDRSAAAGLPGRPGYADRGALALRYRWWYEDFLKPRGLVIPLVISEAGIDGGIPDRPGPEGRGWRDFTGYWKTHGLGDDGVRVYIRQMAWYDAELRQDDYVIGFTVFTAGAMSDYWRSYDITHILRQVATYVVSQR
ncbi:MAG: hypothetical protein ACE5LU_07770 [Anaerolineae bacterium]